MNLKDKIEPDAVRTIDIELKPDPEFFSLVDDFVKKSTRWINGNYEKDKKLISSDDFYDRAVY